MSTPSPREIDSATVPTAAPTPPAGPSRARVPRAVWIVAGLVVLVALYRWWQAPGGDVAEYVTQPVDRGAIEQTVAATGTVNPVKTVQVGTYVSGRIIAIDVDYNSPVTRGQRVAKIDPASFLVKVRQAEASLATARARVEKSRADLELKRLQLDRTRRLVGERILSQSELDAARSNADQAVAQLALDEASVAQAAASLDEARVNLDYTDILSPVDGVVVARNVDVGQTVAASFQTPTLFLIAEDLTKMQVNTNVSESDVGRVRDGQPATFTVDAYPGAPFRGVVAQVRSAPVTVQNVVTYDVVVAVENPNQELKPGMTANVTITTARRDDVLRVPVRALRFRPETPAGARPVPAGDSTVHVLRDDGALAPVAVEIGIRNAEHAEVTGGDIAPGVRAVIGVKRASATTAPTQPPGFGGGRRF